MRYWALLVLVLYPCLGQAQEVTVAPALCQRMAVHVPDDDVTWRPGIGADGRHVVPADLSSGGQNMAQAIIDAPIRIPLTVDLAERLGIDDRGVSLDAPLGEISMVDGQMMFDGRPVNGIDPMTLRAACARKPQ